MPEAVIPTENEVKTQSTNYSGPAPHHLSRRTQIVSVVIAVAAIVGIALGVGLGKGLKQKSSRPAGNLSWTINPRYLRLHPLAMHTVYLEQQL